MVGRNDIKTDVESEEVKTRGEAESGGRADTSLTSTMREAEREGRVGMMQLNAVAVVVSKVWFG